MVLGNAALLCNGLLLCNRMHSGLVVLDKIAVLFSGTNIFSASLPVCAM